MMTQKDIEKVMDLLVAAYGEKAYPTADPKQMAKVSSLWSVMFAEDDPAEVLLAVKNCIATSPYAPHVSDIKSRIAQSRIAGQMTEMEAWINIRKAIKKAGTSAEANQAFSEMPQILRKVVGEPGTLKEWRGVSLDTLEGVIASNCQRSYRELAKTEATFNALPKDIQRKSSWMVSEPEPTMLPEPKPQKTHEERFADMDADAAEYRRKYVLPQSQDMTDRVNAFIAPMTDSERKLMEARQKADAKYRLERMQD